MSDSHASSQSSPDSSSQGVPCPECASRLRPAESDQFLYALGRVEVRFPSIGVEREFQQRERALASKTQAGTRAERMSLVLDANAHLAHRVCYVFFIGQVPAYVVTPSTQATLDALVSAARAAHTASWSILIGRRAPKPATAQCGGIIAPLAICDQIYTFTMDEWISQLNSRIDGALKARNIDPKRFDSIARDLFDRITSSTENIGASDPHRALNYVLVQHPGKALAMAERADTAVLDRIETRVLAGSELRRQVAIILTFLDRATGVPERLFCRVDVTEEWPFVADVQGAGAPLGLLPFVDHALLNGAF